jgi:mono/diheme cytochrome c family protein
MNPLSSLQKAVYQLVIAVVLLVMTGAYAFYAMKSPVATTESQPLTPKAKQTPVLTDPVALKGKTLFSDNCAACHALSDEVVVGPGLKNVHTRKEEAWLVKWVQNSGQLVKSGDPYAVALFNKFNKTPMPNFPFNEADIQAILQYIRVSGE